MINSPNTIIMNMIDVWSWGGFTQLPGLTS